MHVVYGIVDPRSDAIFYIGQTSDFAARKAAHLEGSDQLSGYVVKQIKLNGFVPLFVALERTQTRAQALSAEIFWIETMKSRGARLLNTQGVGGYVERERKRQKLIGELKDMATAKAASADRLLETVANGRSLRAGKVWSKQDLRRLKGMVKARMSLAAMADALERPPAEIRRKIKILDL